MICFIVGHGKSKKGGYDPGACSGGCEEFKIAREIARFACEYYNATYTEQCDIMNYNADKYLTERVAAVNAADYDFIAEFHLNAGCGTGTECYHHIGSEKGRAYAAAISRAIASEFGVTNRGARTKTGTGGKDYFAIIRETKPSAVLIETLFVDTLEDVVKIVSPDGQRRCGEAIAKAVAEVRGAVRKAECKPETLYRVQIGAYSDRKNAEAALEKAKAAGFADAFVTDK